MYPNVEQATTVARCPGCGDSVAVDAEGYAYDHKRTVLMLPEPELKVGRYLRVATAGGMTAVRCPKSGHQIA